MDVSVGDQTQVSLSDMSLRAYSNVRLSGIRCIHAHPGSGFVIRGSI